jgi:hypothetical protein
MPRTKSRGSAAPAASPTDANLDLVKLGAPVTQGHRLQPDLDPDSPFLLAYHPARFTVMGDRCIPELAKVVLAPGVEQCNAIKGHPVYTQTVGVWRKRGYTIIEMDWAPNGKTYLHRVAVRGGYAHLSVFTKANPGSKRLTVDAKGYCDWLDSLLAGDKLPDPQAWKLEEMLESIEDRILARAQLAERDSAVRAQTELWRRQADAIRARLAEIDPSSRQDRTPVEGEQITV